MVCCDTDQKMLPLDQALQHLLDAITPVAAIEQVSLLDALGRILADTLHSPCDVPPHDNSAMDGYAVCCDDLKNNDTLTLIGKSFAGQPFQGELTSGSCVRIMTGALIPQGANAVVMQEHTEAQDQQIRFLRDVTLGDNIRRAGEDIMQGADVLQPGDKLCAADIGLLASLGIAQVNVFQRVRVAIFATGDELVEPGIPLQTGQIYNSNRYTLHCVLQKMGVEIIDLGTLPDDPERLKQTLLHASTAADLVLTSGGVSVGEADFIKSILQQIGTIDFWKVAIKPGKPFAFGRVQQAYFCGLPGNPVSALATFYLLVRPLIETLAGGQASPINCYQAITDQRLKKSQGRMDFQRGILYTDPQGQLHVQSTGSQGSGILSSMSQANCFIVLPQQSGTVEAGSTVQVHPFADCLG